MTNLTLLRGRRYDRRVPFIALAILVVICIVGVIILWLTIEEKRECDRDTKEMELLKRKITRPPKPPRDVP